MKALQILASQFRSVVFLTTIVVLREIQSIGLVPDENLWQSLAPCCMNALKREI